MEPPQPSPISHLIPELLIRIFQLVQDWDSVTMEREYYRWTSVTHVSQHWRQTALGAKMIWGGIIQCNSHVISPWAQESLHRSGNAPLDVKIRHHSWSGASTAFVLDVLGQLHRIRTLEMFTSCDGAFVAESLEEPAPILESLYIHGTMQDGEMIKLFDGVAPNLRYVHIECSATNICSLSLRNLTSLTICTGNPNFPHLISAPSVPISHVLDLLRTTSHLEYLKLVYAFHSPEHWQTRSRLEISHTQNPPLSLPFLIVLSISSPALDCLDFLSIIEIPSTCQVHVDGNIIEGHPETYQPENFINDVTSRLDRGIFRLEGLKIAVGRTTHNEILWDFHWVTQTDVHHPPESVITDNGSDSNLVDYIHCRISDPFTRTVDNWYPIPTSYTYSDLTWVTLEYTVPSRPPQTPTPPINPFSLFSLSPYLRTIKLRGHFVEVFSEYVTQHPECRLPSLEMLDVTFNLWEQLTLVESFRDALVERQRRFAIASTVGTPLPLLKMLRVKHPHPERRVDWADFERVEEEFEGLAEVFESRTLGI